jgi:signal transduction histidine kinase
MAPANPHPLSTVLSALARGFRFSWTSLLIILLVNTGIATLESVDDMRPFWHPFVTVQACGLAIAYCVNVAVPWNHRRPIVRLMIAVAIGATLGHLLMIPIKNFILEHLLGQPRLYTLDYFLGHKQMFFFSFLGAFLVGLCISAFFLLKFRDARAAEALHKAEAERLLLAKHAMESELKLMQAQIEPHFLFNTLASVQYLTETDPPEASRLLGHLLSYLRAALPQMRNASATLGHEIEFAEAYLNILKMRMGSRLDFRIDVPNALREHPFPPVLLISVVENAVTHGLEPLAAGGHIAIAARQEGDRVQVTVTDTGMGLAAASRPGQGVGLLNVRERLAALFGPRGRFTLEDATPRGARATIEIPAEAPTRTVGARTVGATA